MLNQLNHHLEIITTECKKAMKEIISLILYGGYGRDEGSWYLNEKKVWSPYNDYDIVVITNSKTEDYKIERLRKLLAKKIGIKWIDILQLSTGELGELKSSIRNYDIKYASKIFYGDKNILKIIPEIDNTKLPLKEIETLYFTRLYTLLGSLDINGLNQDLKGDKSRFFRNQMAKAVLACADVLLLVKGEYVSSYRERIQKVIKLYPEKKDFLKMAAWALEEKLFPKAPLMKKEEVFNLYLNVHTLFHEEMYKGLTQYYKGLITGPKNIEYYFRKSPYHILKRIYWIIRLRSLNMEKQLLAFVSQSYIAASWTKIGINDNLFTIGLAKLSKARTLQNHNLSWDAARIEACKRNADN